MGSLEMPPLSKGRLAAFWGGFDPQLQCATGQRSRPVGGGELTSTRKLDN